jgi:hypothetical protein
MCWPPRSEEITGEARSPSTKESPKLIYKEADPIVEVPLKSGFSIIIRIWMMRLHVLQVLADALGLQYQGSAGWWELAPSGGWQTAPAAVVGGGRREPAALPLSPAGNVRPATACVRQDNTRHHPLVPKYASPEIMRGPRWTGQACQVQAGRGGGQGSRTANSIEMALVDSQKRRGSLWSPE